MSANARKLVEPINESTATEYATQGAKVRKLSRPDLKLVSQLRPEKASRGVFALLVGGLLGAGLVVMLLINTSLASGAFVVSELQTQKSALTVEAQALSKEVDAMSSPANLEAKARALGMKPSKNPVFLNLGDGSILGKPNGANVSPNAPLPRLATPADLTAVEAVDNSAVTSDFPTTVGPNYDPAAADAAAAGAATAEDSAWGEIVDVTDTPKAARAGKSGKAGQPGKKAKIAKSDSGLSATPIG
jgi:hypothetical protein